MKRIGARLCFWIVRNVLGPPETALVKLGDKWWGPEEFEEEEEEEERYG